MKPRRDGRVRCSAWLGGMALVGREGMLLCMMVCEVCVLLLLFRVLIEQYRVKKQSHREGNQRPSQPDKLLCLPLDAAARKIRKLGSEDENLGLLGGNRGRGDGVAGRDLGNLRAKLLNPFLKLFRCGHNAERVMPPNDPSSATRPARASDCNREAMAGFAAAHG